MTDFFRFACRRLCWRDGSEGADEASEDCELVKRLGFGERERLRFVAPTQLNKSGSRDGAFKMRVQLDSWQRAKEVSDAVTEGHILAMWRFDGTSECPSSRRRLRNRRYCR